MSELRVIVVGASGRMGRMLVRAIIESGDAEVVGATERAGCEFIGCDIGDLAGVESLGVALVDNINACADADVLIDFSTPEATLANAEFAAGRNMRMIVGTTGFEAKQLQQLQSTLSGSPVVM